MWRLIKSFERIPTDCDLMLAVVDREGVHMLEFPCRRGDGLWLDKNGRAVDVHPTHWREWTGTEEGT